MTWMNRIRQRYGPTALITGASSGIGKAFAEELAACGLNLVLVARRENALAQLKDELRTKHGVSVLPIALDLSAPGAIDEIEAALAESGIEVSLLVNNAGFGSHGEFDALDPQNEARMIDLNCRVVVVLTRRFLPAMKQRRQGGVIITGSILSVLPAPYMSVYSATKAFELMFAESLCGECKPHNVDVLALLPGSTATEFFDAARIKRKMEFVKRTPRDVAKTALRALGKKPRVVDGWKNKALIALARFMPRKWLIALSAKSLR